MDTAICSPRGGSGDAPADLKEWIQSSGDRGSNPASTRCSSQRARRSVSLQDLSAAADRQREAARSLNRTAIMMPRGDDSPSVSGGATSSAVAETGQREAYLVYKVYNRLLKMVANRRRLHNTAMQEAVDTMTAKITNLNLQVSTLKHILASDERVVMSWAAEIQSLKSSLGAAAKQIIQLRKERAELERRLEELDSLGQDLKARLMNEKNERELANDETAALRLQLDKERHKMARIKRDKLALIDKMVELNKGNRTKDEEIRTLSSEVVDLEDLVKKQKRIINQAEERTKEDAVLLRKANDEIAGLKNNLLLSTEANGILKGEMVDLEMALLKKEEECKSLEKLSHSQMIRLVELQARLGRFESQTWGYRVLKAASSLAQLPVTVMEAITFPNVEEKCPPRRTKL